MKKGVIALTLLAIIFAGYFFVVRADNKPEQPIVTENTQPQTPKKPTREELLKLINAERSKAGVAPLKIDPRLNKSAQYKADDMVKRNYYAHADPITGKQGYEIAHEMMSGGCSYASENISADNDTAGGAMNDWMNSTPHREAILKPSYSLTGFGIAQEQDGDFYMVEHFCIPK